MNLSRAETLLRTWPVGAAGLAVDVGMRKTYTAGDVDAVLPWASITKIVISLTVLEAAADGEVDLDDPAGPPGATLRHLLAHAAGLAFEGGRTVGAAGTRRSYSNVGYERAAEHVAAATGRPFADDVRERVLDPLGMTATTLEGSPASGMRGPVTDLVRLAADLLRPRVLHPEIVRQASTLAFPGLDGVLPGYGRQSPNDWGLGCEIRDGKSPHWTAAGNSPATFGHFGQAGGFLWVDPVAGVACCSLSDTPFGPWAVEAWPVLSQAVLDAVTEG